MTATGLVPPFPAPPRAVRTALEHLRQTEDAGLEPAGLPLLDRPWDPAACTPHVRAQLWPWLEDVAGWLNATFGWQTAHTIPACWPAHPSLVAELAVLACLRAAAGDASSPHAMEEWHRYALPGFTTRMADRLGIGCPPGRHLDWPARSWAAAYDSSEAAEARRDRFDADTGHGRRTPAAGLSARHPQAVTP
ncbi:hypothetical protein SAMN05660657_03306 [Geodermatophilus amargosae]|uniref:Uncharacterized protein n=1 Tax=Geodermatophilus amargosae TaxID=1296565 RepID=A0A1I7B5Q5_9ACTN|nr:hypothetical protein [Geodermatophilus amargosae]SFT82491.1 hypothetical protein SAMN05660657_03306 [Geodermatophilus amargosae]